MEQGLQLLKIFKDYSSKQCILDDFEFYEDRQKRIQEKKAKQQQFQKQVCEHTAQKFITCNLTSCGFILLADGHILLVVLLLTRMQLPLAGNYLLNSFQLLSVGVGREAFR